jgi:hypothetical protein
MFVKDSDCPGHLYTCSLHPSCFWAMLLTRNSFKSLGDWSLEAALNLKSRHLGSYFSLSFRPVVKPQTVTALPRLKSCNCYPAAAVCGFVIQAHGRIRAFPKERTSGCWPYPISNQPRRKVGIASSQQLPGGSAGTEWQELLSVTPHQDSSADTHCLNMFSRIQRWLSL